MDTATVDQPSAIQPESNSESSFAKEVCLPFLQKAQNEDGGWGFQPGLRSRVEPTCWAALALGEFPGFRSGDEMVDRSARFLRDAQLPDGSWPASAGQEKGCWVTSLACWALRSRGDSRRETARGLRWLCNAWPREGGLWWRLQARITGSRKLAIQNDKYRGWSWTPNTSSWVEPTAYALLALRSTAEGLIPRATMRRKQLAEAMLYDRMCPGGGWNSGNPVVYGVAGEPQLGATAWALLALQDNSHRPENRKSIAWLESNWTRIQGPASLALAAICLETYGRPVPSFESSLREIHERNEFLQNVQVVAWTVLGLSGQRRWLQGASTRMD